MRNRVRSCEPVRSNCSLCLSRARVLLQTRRECIGPSSHGPLRRCRAKVASGSGNRSQVVNCTCLPLCRGSSVCPAVCVLTRVSAESNDPGQRYGQHCKQCTGHCVVGIQFVVTQRQHYRQFHQLTADQSVV